MLRRGPKLRDVPLPQALVPDGPIDTRTQRAALRRLAESIRAGDGRYRALEDVLARAHPRFTGGKRATIQTMELAEQRELAASLDRSYLFVQGPPGTGKTWTGARATTRASSSLTSVVGQWSRPADPDHFWTPNVMLSVLHRRVG